MQLFKQGMRKESFLSVKGVRKGYLFYQRWYISFDAHANSIF